VKHEEKRERRMRGESEEGGERTCIILYVIIHIK